jgi:hypothetical protein
MAGVARLPLVPVLPDRLADMVAVEALASSAVAPGLGQRLADVASALQHRRPQIERIELLDPLADFSLAWRRVLHHLPVVDASMVEPAGRSGTMLRDLQDALCHARDGERASRLAWRGDGTLRVVRAETVLGAAQWQAMQMRQGHASHVVVAPSGGSLLDAALAAADRPRLGLAGASTLRPALQLVPLAMKLLWAPLDFSALLQFLTHPLHPIHPMARRRIAERLADAPGIGGKGWQELLDEIAADLGERGARVMADVAFWIEHERFDPAERAPLSAALERAERLATFFSNRLLDEDLARRAAWHAGHAQASALRLALQALMAQGDDRIGPEMLNKLVAQASGRGSGNPLLDAQAGALPSVTDPAAVVEPFDEVTWWQLAAGPIPAPYVWSKSEIESLRAAGVELPEIPSLLERQARGALRPLLLARERLTLVLPPPGQEVHPVWLLVEGLLDKNVPIETCGERARGRTRGRNHPGQARDAACVAPLVAAAGGHGGSVARQGLLQQPAAAALQPVPVAVALPGTPAGFGAAEHAERLPPAGPTGAPCRRALVWARGQSGVDDGAGRALVRSEPRCHRRRRGRRAANARQAI